MILSSYTVSYEKLKRLSLHFTACEIAAERVCVTLVCDVHKKNRTVSTKKKKIMVIKKPEKKKKKPEPMGGEW